MVGASAGKPGTRVAGVRTYSLLGGGGGLAAVLGALISTAVTALLVLSVCAGLVVCPAFAFVAIVAAAAVLTRRAQARFGEAGNATSLFLTGSFDVDAAIVTLSGLPTEAIDRCFAAIALSGTIVANMALKVLVTAAYARTKGAGAAAGLAASTLALLLTIGWRLFAG